jgi:hypothetical protein
MGEWLTYYFPTGRLRTQSSVLSPSDPEMAGVLTKYPSRAAD